VSVNLLIGSLVFKEGTIEFKTNSAEQLTTPNNEEERVASTGQRSSITRSVVRSKNRL
jgi:hypothetical protein